MEGIQDEGDQAKDVEVHRARCVPATYENEQPNEQVEKTYHAQIIFDGSRLFRGCGNEWCLKLSGLPRELIANLVPEASAVQPTGDLHRSGNGGVIYGNKLVAGPNSGPCCRRVRRDLPRFDA